MSGEPMRKTPLFLFLWVLLCASLPVSRVAAKTATEEKPPLVLMPLQGGPGIDADSIAPYESAVKKALAEKYTVYSGDRVVEKLKKIFQKRSAGKKGELECDETKCFQDVAIAFQSELVAAAHITKKESGYLLSINIVNVVEDSTIFSNSTTCRGCDELEVVESLYVLAGGKIVEPAAKGAPPEPTRRTVKENTKYADWGDGTITAKNTGLMWQKQDDGKERNWDNAIAYCKGLRLAGHRDWRLPSIEELKSLIEMGNNPTIDTEYFPGTKSSYYWSSTANSLTTSYAWNVYFGNGFAATYYKTDLYYARCVRPGQ